MSQTLEQIRQYWNSRAEGYTLSNREASHFPVGTADQTGTEWTNLPACAGCGMWSGVLLCFACQTGI